MTVGETLTASSLGSNPVPSGTSGVVTEPVNDSRGQKGPASEVNQPMVVVGGNGASNAGPGVGSTMAPGKGSW